MIKKLTILIWGILKISGHLAVGQKTSFLIGPEVIYLDGNDSAYNEVGPGGTLFFAAGNRKYLLIKNFRGSTFRPIVMINLGGAVTIDTDHYFGISLQNCSNFKFTGTGEPGLTYGFQVKRVANGGGMGIGELSTNFEIEHVSIENCMIGGGSKCDCYNNFISQGKGNGIESHGLGEYKIFNNIILDAGRSFRPTDLTQMKHGIFITDVSVQADAAFHILHNNIINPKSEGIRFSSLKSKGSQISSNVIINPGNFDYYEIDNTSFKGKDSYIMFQYTASDATVLNNYLARNADFAGFVSPDMQLPNDFKLTKGSPLIDVADASNVVGFDFLGILRPYGAQSDVGAFEYDGSTSSLIQPQNTGMKSRLLQNPVKGQLKISIQQEFGSDIYLEIFNLQSVSVLQQSKIKVEKNLIAANVSDLAPGIYIYSIRSVKHSESVKFIIF